MFLYAQNGIIFEGCSTYSSFWSLYIHLQFHSPIAYILLYMVLRSGKNRMLGDGGSSHSPKPCNPRVSCLGRSMNDKYSITELGWAIL